MSSTTAGGKSPVKTITDSSGIFESGFMSDCTVRCRDRVWKTHKLILCSRSEFFKAALMGNFKEAETGEVVLREQNPEHVDNALRFIYSGNLNHITSLRDYDFMDTKLDTVRICVALYQLGDFLRVASLCNEAQTELHHMMKLNAQHIKAFTKYAKIAYSIPESKDPSIKGSIRHPFIHFFTLTRFNVIGEEDFLQELQAIPGLLADILWQLARVDRGEDSHCDAEQLYEKHRRTINQECQICKKDPLFDDISQEVNLWMVGKKCYKCWSDERGDITALGGVGEDDLKKLPKFLYLPDNL